MPEGNRMSRTLTLSVALCTLSMLGACGSDTDADTDTDAGTGSNTDAGTDSVTDADPTAIALDNASFETPAGSPGSWSMVAPTGWTLTQDGLGGTFRPNAAAMNVVEPLASPADGNSAAWLGAAAGDGFDLMHNNPIEGTYRTGDVITARVAVAKRKDKTLTGTGSAFITLIPLGFTMYCVPTASPTFAELTSSEGDWLEASMMCSAPSDGNLNMGTVRFGALGLTGTGDQLIFDNVRINIETP